MELIEIQEAIKTEIEKVTVPEGSEAVYNLKSLHLTTKDDVKDIFISIVPSDYDIEAATRKAIYEDNTFSVVINKLVKTEEEFIILNNYSKSIAKKLFNKSFICDDGTIVTSISTKIIKAYNYDDIAKNKFEFVIGLSYRSLTNLEDN